MEILCEFKNIQGEDKVTKYTCFPSKSTVCSRPGTKVKTFIGTHLPGKSDEDVEAISFIGGEIEYIPRGICRLFPSLLCLEIKNCGLRMVTKRDLVDLENLQGIYLESNSFKSHPYNLFASMKKLQRVSISGNKISSVTSNNAESGSDEKIQPGVNTPSGQLTNNAQKQAQLECRRLLAALVLRESSFAENSQKLFDLEEEKKKLQLKCDQLQENYDLMILQNTELEVFFENALAENEKLQDIIDLQQKQIEESQDKESKILKIQKRADELQKTLSTKSKDFDLLNSQKVAMQYAYIDLVDQPLECEAHFELKEVHRNETRDLKKTIEELRTELRVARKDSVKQTKLTESFLTTLSSELANLREKIQDQYRVVKAEIDRSKQLIGEMRHQLEYIKALEIDSAKHQCETHFPKNNDIDYKLSPSLIARHPIPKHQIPNHFEELRELINHPKKLNSCPSKTKSIVVNIEKKTRKAGNDWMKSSDLNESDNKICTTVAAKELPTLSDFNGTDLLILLLALYLILEGIFLIRT